MADKIQASRENGTFAGSGLRDNAMHELGVGTTRDMNSVIGDIFFRSWTCPAYTLGEKIDLWRAKFGSANDELKKASQEGDLTVLVPSLELPVYFFSGGMITP